MPADRQQVDPQLLRPKRKLAVSLNPIHMNQRRRTGPFYRLFQDLDRLNRAKLVINRHHAYQNRIAGHRFQNRFFRNTSVRIWS